MSMADEEPLAGIGQGAAASRLATLLGGDSNNPDSDEPEAVEELDHPSLESLDSDEKIPGSTDGAPEKASATDKGGEPEGVIAAPASWDAEAKEAFKKLSPDLQRVVVQRESDRDKGVQQRLQEVAEERRGIEAQREQVAQQRQQYEQHLMALATQIESSVPKEFQDIKNSADFVRVSTDDPARAARFMAWREYAASVFGQIQQSQQMRQQEQAQQQQAVLQGEMQKLATAFPEFVDSEKGHSWRQDIASLLSEEGFNKQEIDGLADHRIVLHMKKHIEMRKELAALKASKDSAAKKLERAPQRVIAPQRGGEPEGQGLTRSQSIRVARSGNRSAVQATLERLLND